MHEVVRSRTLTALDLTTIPAAAELPTLTGWHRLRLDLQLEHQRYRKRHLERTLELATMAGSRAAEAVVATHVENALELAWLLKGVMPVNTAADHYIREFGLPAGVAQMVLQRVQARVAGDELTAQYDEPLPRCPSRSRPTPPGLRRAGPRRGRSAGDSRRLTRLEFESHREIDLGRPDVDRPAP